LVGILITLVVLAAMAFMIFGGNSPAMSVRTETIAIEKAAGTEMSVITLKNGAGTMSITGGSDGAAVSGKWETNFLEPKIESTVDGKTQKIELRAEGNWRGWGRHSNNLDLRLSDTMPAQLEIDTGAVSLDADLSSVTLEALKINTGASSVKLTLGDKATSTSVLLHAGASSIKITVPKTAGVRLRLVSGLTSKDLPDFEQVGENQYQSKDYASAVKKIDMNLELGVSSLKIDWK
ncbi:MAG: toast rack family protein, partial [Patescibacteria group bacterium]